MIDESNSKTVYCSTRYILSRAAFRRGFEDVNGGIPFNPEAFCGDAEAQWMYERGRLFAYLYFGRLKYGRTVSERAKRAFDKAFDAYEIT